MCWIHSWLENQCAPMVVLDFGRFSQADADRLRLVTEPVNFFKVPEVNHYFRFC